MSGPFENWTDADVVSLIERNPFAWVVSAAAGLSATPLPMLVETDEDGRPTALVGHFAKSNPQIALLRQDPRALFLFQGAHGYISPEWLSDRNWAPTWNYAIAKIGATVLFDEALNEEALLRLVEKMESGRPNPWKVEEMGPRYHGMKAGILAFRAIIQTVDARFKLGQDERPEVLEEIVNGLGEDPLAEMMRRFNPTAL